jgi:hypothetical protein
MPPEAPIQAATSRDEEIARRAFCAGFPVPRWCASVRLTMSNRSRARVALCAVTASGLKPSAAAFNRLRPGPTVPVRALLTVALRATSSKHGPRGPEADVGSGDESPREMFRSYAHRARVSTPSSTPSSTRCQDSLEMSSSSGDSRTATVVERRRAISDGVLALVDALALTMPSSSKRNTEMVEAGYSEGRERHVSGHSCPRSCAETTRACARPHGTQAGYRRRPTPDTCPPLEGNDCT